MPETFFGLTAMQVQGWATIASIILTAVLVGTTIVYALLTRKIATAAIQSSQYQLRMEREERERKRQIVGMVLASMVTELGAMIARNLPNEAVTKTLPDRVPWLSVPNEILMTYAQGVGLDVFLKVGTALRNIEAADAGLNRMRLVRDLAQLGEIATAVQSSCRVGQRIAEECLVLVRQAAEAEVEGDLSEHFRDGLAQFRGVDRES